MSDNGRSEISKKETVEKEDGRYLILYTFDMDSGENTEETGDNMSSNGRGTRN